MIKRSNKFIRDARGTMVLSDADAKIVKLFVDDEPFWLATANMLRFVRRLNVR